MPATGDDVSLLRGLHAASTTAGADGWRGFAGDLAAIAHAQGAMLRIDTRAGALSLSPPGCGPGPSPEPALLRAMRFDRVYAQTDLGVHEPLRCLRVDVAEQVTAWLTIWRPSPDFRAIDSVRLDRLAPHLGPALAIWLELERERAQARTAAGIAHDLGAGWLWLAPTGRVVAHDPALPAILAPVNGVRLTAAGWLAIDEPGARNRLRQAIERAQTGGGDTAIVTLAQTPLCQIALHPGMGPPAPGCDAVLTATLRRAPIASPEYLDRVAGGLGLGRSEARLAAALCDGATLAEAAQTLGWTIETARSTSKQIFAKTATRGQADLIRRMHAGALWCSAPAQPDPKT